ncbi:antiterminator Q family protein [Avibacterium gallinarum]|uniref:Antitermination protein n=1 Tax=Caviibacterium pharyngocola TaxID=28159 RepID=A0A2M8RY37_9PAST|nr:MULTISPECIES: antiterminator Q family protein [Pasteurellaceae]MCW9733723.1 hypothetical protein [Avibacterium sp. 20-15]PJG83799.1 hypothetical protein CVP04_01530 [Caviibacterium pharyngocola]URL03572.1 hypothetical protein L4F93_08365 [Avibacterium sp. 20-132]
MTKEEFKLRLDDWGLWSREFDLGVDYPRHALGIEGAEQDPSRSITLIEEEILAVECAVCELKKIDILGYEMIKSFYIDQLSQATIAKKINRSRHYVEKVFTAAEHFIYGFLCRR